MSRNTRFTLLYGRCGLASLFTALLLGICAFARADNSPTQAVREAVDQIVEVLKRDDESHTQKWAEIGKLIDANFDFRSMSQSVLATNWQAASKAEKRQFVEYFAQYLEVAYRNKIESYTNQKIEYGKESIRNDRATVDTWLVTNAARIPINYKLKLNDGQWVAYDVTIDGGSLINNSRDTFAAIVRAGGMDGLLRDLESKIADYKAHHGISAAGASLPPSTK